MSESEIVGADRLNATLDRMIEALSPAGRKILLNRIVRRVAAENRKRIGANVSPDGAAFTPRKRAGKGIRQRMFVRLKSTRWLKTKTFPDEARVFFYGGAAGLAREHHYGLRARLRRPSNKRIPMPARELLGISDDDKSMIEDMILEHFAKAF
jgi:phage virion morphogenesis protein